MRFEGDAAEDEDTPIRKEGNRWYFFLPLPMVGLWLVVSSAHLIAGTLTWSVGGGPPEPTDAFHDALSAMEWLGGLGWVLLFPFYLVVLSTKRASAWWALGAFCFGLNLPLYIALLFLPTRRRLSAATDPAAPPPIGAENLPRPTAFRLKHSFVCDSCDALINYGVSECSECGQRYRYAEGTPLAADAPDPRER